MRSKRTSSSVMNYSLAHNISRKPKPNATFSNKGSVPYFGIAASAPVCGMILQTWSQKRFLVVSLLVNTFFCGMLAFAGKISLLLFGSEQEAGFGLMVAARACIGMSQGPLVIYGAVWVAEFAPANSKTMWVGLLQVGVPLGVMFGYVGGGLMSAYNFFLIITNCSRSYSLRERKI